MWLLPLARPPILSLISCWHSSPSSPALPVTDPSTLFPSFLHFLPPSSLALLSLLSPSPHFPHLNSICLTTPSPHPPTAPSLTFHHLLTLTPAFGYFLPSFHPPSTLHQLYIYIYYFFEKATITSQIGCSEAIFGCVFLHKWEWVEWPIHEYCPVYTSVRKRRANESSRWVLEGSREVVEI